MGLRPTAGTVPRVQKQPYASFNVEGPLARNVDKPIAGLLRDLKSRGMLDDTLIIYISDNGYPFPGAKTTVYQVAINAAAANASATRGSQAATFSYAAGAATRSRATPIDSFLSTVKSLPGPGES